MSKRGQYVRHAWTHRTQSQKLPEYGRIDLDECTITGAKTIVPDSDDELSDDERTAKRRKIEKLAQDYLKGEPLFISSVRSCPQALKRSIVWQKKSSNEPGFILPQIDTSKESTQVWEEVEDDEEILKRLTGSLWSQQSVRKPRPDHSTGRTANTGPVEEVKAQASCKPQRPLRALNVDHGPSEAALRQAAALRNRKVRQGAAQPPTVEGPQEATTPLSDPSDRINVTQSERVLRSQKDKREWLSRRKSRFSFGGGDATCGATTASSPCVAGSSPPSQSLRRQAASSPGNKSGQAPVSEHYLRSSLQQGPADRSAIVIRRPAEPVEARSSPGSGNEQHGSAILAREPQENHDSAQSHERPPPGESTTTKQARSAPVSSSRAAQQHTKPSYLQAPSTQNGTTPLMYRKRRGRSKAADQQEPAMATTTIATRRSNRRRVTFPSSEDPQTVGAQAEVQPNVGSHPPVLDMSFQHDESFAPRLNMALVEEHMNKVLPEESPSSTGATSVKRALRRELRHSGAEMTRVDSEPPPTSQPDNISPEREEDVIPSAKNQRSQRNDQQQTLNFDRRQTWLGTQAMVARAERELFTSPEKQQSTFTPINEQKRASQQRHRVEEQSRLSQEREPSKQLSQEPAPSTQAMLEAFGGFSTVKKPRAPAMLNPTLEPTPVAAEKGKRVEHRPVPEPKWSSLQRSSTSDKARDSRGSSLRFSISSFDSPAPNHDKDQLHPEPPQVEEREAPSNTTSLATPVPSSSSVRKSTLKSSHPQASYTDRHPQRRSSQTHDMFSQSMLPSTDPPTMSFQAAQGPEVPSGLLRDPSDLSQTIDDLARDVLGTSKEMSAVWSQ